MNLNELRQMAHDLNEEATAIMDLAIGEGREMSEDEEGKVTAFENQLAKVNEDVAIAEKLNERRERMAVSSRQSAAKLPEMQSNITLPGLPGGQDDTGGFANLAEFAMSVYGAHPNNSNPQMDQRLSDLYSAGPTGYHREGGATEGFMIPPKFRNEIWDLVFSDENLISMTDLEPTNSNRVEWLADEDTPWGAGGIHARWRAEASKMDPERILTQKRGVDLHELYCFVLATDELMEDAPRMNRRLTKKAATAISWKIDDSLLWGTGVGQMLGFMNSNALITVPKESGQSADSVVVRNFSNMFSRLLGNSVSRAQWLMNSDIVPELIDLTLGTHPIWTPPMTGIKGAPGGHILGRPIRFSEHCKALGDKGDLMLVDLAGFYAARKASGLKFATSIHLYFDYGMQAFRWTIRLGGQPYLSAPIERANSTKTKSHFITLGERA